MGNILDYLFVLAVTGIVGFFVGLLLGGIVGAVVVS